MSGIAFILTEDGRNVIQTVLGIGGLELHHILGKWNCAFNSCLLCKQCHNKIVHNIDEHRWLFVQTLRFLHSINYKPTEEDIQFVAKHDRILTGKLGRRMVASLIISGPNPNKKIQRKFLLWRASYNYSLLLNTRSGERDDHKETAQRLQSQGRKKLLVTW